MSKRKPARTIKALNPALARAIIVVAAMRVVFGHCPRDQVPDFTAYSPCALANSSRAS
jgi:hypothetical protein